MASLDRELIVREALNVPVPAPPLVAIHANAYAAAARRRFERRIFASLLAVVAILSATCTAKTEHAGTAVTGSALEIRIPNPVASVVPAEYDGDTTASQKPTNVPNPQPAPPPNLA